MNNVDKFAVPTNTSSCYGVAEDANGRLVCADRHNTGKKCILPAEEDAKEFKREDFKDIPGEKLVAYTKQLS
jgi:hypothetical protein